MNKFKKGDEVRVVRRLNGHQLELGNIYTINHVDEDVDGIDARLMRYEINQWWVSENEMEFPWESKEIRRFFEILTVDGETFNFQESVEGQLDSIISRFYNKDIATLVIPDDKDFNTGGCIIVKDKITAIKWD